MAIYRTEKTENFTPLSNDFLRSTTLSLKAKAMLGAMLSYPDDWVFSLKGLACYCRESVKGVRSAVRELEELGYIVRRDQHRREGGRYAAADYDIFETSLPPSAPKRTAAKRKSPERKSPGRISVKGSLQNNDITNNDITNTERERISLLPHGAYGNVLLSEEELRNLGESYPDRFEDLIEQLSVYLYRTHKHYRSHYLTLRSCTFAADDGSVPRLASARRYADTFEERSAKNEGLLLWGDVGTGKTFYAACVANALIDRGIPVLMTSFARILNSMGTLYSGDRNEFVSGMMRYPLLVIDDLGAERNSDFALEQIYYVIDERYKTRLPLIVTTNLSLPDLRHPADTARRRIYDRLLEMCIPIRMDGPSRRETLGRTKVLRCADSLEGRSS